MSDTAGQVSDETMAGQPPICEHYWAWVSPAGTKKSALICMTCHSPNPEWLNHIVELDLGDKCTKDGCLHCEFGDALLDTVDALRAERDAACERLARVEALHVPYAPRPYGTAPPLKYTCQHDRMPWPCRTIAALTDTAKEATT